MSGRNRALRLALWIMAASTLAGAGVYSPLQPALQGRLTEGREVVTVTGPPGPAPGFEGKGRLIGFSSRVFVRAPAARVRQFITDFASYPALSPNVVRAEYSAAARTLRLEGRLWRYHGESVVRIEERGPYGLRYTVISGMSTGMAGDVVLEPAGNGGTILSLDGAVFVGNWTPVFVVDRGCRTVLDLALSRLRDRIERGG